MERQRKKNKCVEKRRSIDEMHEKREEAEDKRVEKEEDENPCQDAKRIEVKGESVETEKL